MQYELAIVGGGPAGVAAAVYAARKKIKTVLITDAWGGQSLVSNEIQNWIGTVAISGEELAKNMEAHARAQEDLTIKDKTLVEKIEKTGGGFKLSLTGGEVIESKLILITSGSHRRKLNVPGDDVFNGRGVVYCSTCDAPIFKNKTVAVVGGGNAGLEAVVDLFPYASKIYLIIRSGAMKGDAVTQEKINSSPKVEILFNALTQEIMGDKFVTGLRYQDTAAKTTKELKLDGVFVEIGSVPNSGLVKDFVETNAIGEIVVNHKTQQAMLPGGAAPAEGIWAAGDVSDVLYKQNNVSMGDAVKAVLNIYEYLHKSDAKRGVT